MADVNYEYVSWNADFYKEEIKNGLSETRFIEQGIAEGHYKTFSSKDQVELLKEAYRLIKTS